MQIHVRKKKSSLIKKKRFGPIGAGILNLHRRTSFQPGLQDESPDDPDSHRVVDASQLDTGVQKNGCLPGTRRLALGESIFGVLSEYMSLEVVKPAFRYFLSALLIPLAKAQQDRSQFLVPQTLASSSVSETLADAFFIRI